MTRDNDRDREIDENFQHTINEMAPAEREKLEWLFTISGEDAQVLSSVAKVVQEEFTAVEIEETPESREPGDEHAPSRSTLTIIRRGGLSAAEVKSIADRLEDIAERHELRFEGIDCQETMDLDDLMAWMSPEDQSMFRNLVAETEQEPQVDDLNIFILQTPDRACMEAVSQDLRDHGIDEVSEFEDLDDIPQLKLCAFIHGLKEEPDREEAIECMSRIAENRGCRLEKLIFHDGESKHEVMFLDEQR